jgi:hypothetical protein
MCLAVFEAIIEKGLFTQKFRGAICHQTHFTRVVNRFQGKNHAQEHKNAQDKSQNRVCRFAFHNESGKLNESAKVVQRVFAMKISFTSALVTRSTSRCHLMI